MTSNLTFTLLVGADTPDGCVRLDTTDLHLLNISAGDVVSMEGTRQSFVRVLPAFMEDRNQKIARVSERTARNIGYLHGRSVRFLGERIKPHVAELVTLEAENDLDRLHLLVRQNHLSDIWQNRVLASGDEIEIPSLDTHSLAVRITNTQPSGAVTITHATQFVVSLKNKTSYPSLGGMRDLYMTCREMVATRFKKTGEYSAGSILLSGPSGCGKASFVKRLAQDVGAICRVFDTYQLLDQLLEGGGTELSFSLSDLSRNGPVILLIDHLEALNEAFMPEMRHTVLAQICDVLEEIPMQPNLFLFAVCSGQPKERLLKGRLFSSRFNVDLPNMWGRHEILIMATEGKKLGQDVDLSSLAELSGGLSAQNLVSLVDEAFLKANNKPLTQLSLISSLRSFSVSTPDHLRCDIPTVFWGDLAGCDKIKRTLHETLLLSLRQDKQFTSAGVNPPRSILLSGGEGTGKTSLARALASFVPLNFIEISCPLLISREPAEAKDFIRDVFVLARRKAPCLIFLDDLESLFDSDLTPDNTFIRHPLVEQLMMEIDAIESLAGVIVIAATSRPDRLTNEILRAGRFDFALALSLPDTSARKKILQSRVKKMPLAANIDFDRLASMTQGFSPADLTNMCNRVGLMAFSRSFNGEGGVIPPVVDPSLFEQALHGRKAD